jgi:Tol biopolymer transport system component
MKYNLTTILLLSCAPLMSGHSYAQDEFPVLQGAYLGQKPPSLTPEIFAPGIVSINGRDEKGISFSPDLTEIYFSANKKDEETAIYFSKLEGEKWAPIKKANFTKGKMAAEMYPFVSLSEDKIYFSAHDSDFTDNKIWYVNRLGNSWSNATKINSPINDDEVFFSNQAKNGDLYYTNILNANMYYAANQNGQYPEVKKVELEFGGHHGFISPSQDYLVVQTQSNEEKKDADISVYFKQKDGTWSKPISLGTAVNSTFNERCPSITPDGKYLFFSRSNEENKLSNFYWVSTEIIEKLRPKL